MSLNDMPVESSVHQHRTLYVHLVAHLQQTEVRTVERLLHGCHHVLVALNGHNGQTDAVMGDTLVDLQFIDK